MGAEKARLYAEFGRVFVAMAALTDAGDHTVFGSGTPPKFWSRVSGFEPKIRPNGMRSGGEITPGAGNSTVNVAASEVNLNGVITTVAADDVTFTRPANNKVKISSVVVTSGGAYAEAVGADGDSYSETRGAAGGPPLIATNAVEVGQVKLFDDGAVPAVAADIRQVPGTHMEMYNFPLWTVDYFKGQITFADALPLIHTGPVAKAVYAEYSTASFAPVTGANNVKPPIKTYSVTSNQDYDGVTASSSSALGQGSFDLQRLDNAIEEPIMQLEGLNLWFKFFPDRFKSAYRAFQGILGVDPSYPASGAITAACTVSAENENIKVAV